MNIVYVITLALLGIAAYAIVYRVRQRRTLKKLQAEVEVLERQQQGDRVVTLLPKARPSSYNVVGIVIAVVVLLGIPAILFSRVIFGKPLGRSCSESNDCRSGMCLLSTGSSFLVKIGVCTEPCLAPNDCDPGLICSDRYCVPVGKVEYAGDCRSTWDCKSQICLSIPDAFGLSPAEGFCSRPCATQQCPEGSDCGNIADGRYCVPEQVKDKLRQRAFEELYRSLKGPTFPQPPFPLPRQVAALSSTSL